MNTQTLSFPTVAVPGIGAAVSRKILISRGGVTGNEIYKIQSSLVEGTDYTCAVIGGGCAQNFYSLSAVLKIAQWLPTEELQGMADECRSLMYPTQPQALPQATHQPTQQAEPRDRLNTTAYATPQQQVSTIPAYDAAPIAQYSDPRVLELGRAVASSMPVPASSNPMSQRELLDGIRALQSDTVGHVRAGFDMAMTAQAATADTIRKSRPNVTTNNDNRAYNAYEYMNHQLNGMGKWQFAILGSALFCVASVGVWAVASYNRSEARYQQSPTSLTIEYRSNQS